MGKKSRDVTAVERYTLFPTTVLLIRALHLLQLGLDGTRAGIIDLGPARASTVITLLLDLRSTPLPLSELIHRFCVIGMPSPLARNIANDLLFSGHLVPAQTPHRVSLVGHTALAEAIARLLHRSGIDVLRKPPDNEVSWPVIGVQQLTDTWRHSLDVHLSAPTYLPVELIDHAGVIGPLRIDGRGPCPLCTNLYRCSIDPQWPKIAAQQPNGPAHPDPLLVQLTAVRTVQVVHGLLDTWRQPQWERTEPGALEPGTQWHVELSATEVRYVPVHSRCPRCFENNSIGPVRAAIPRETHRTFLV